MVEISDSHRVFRDDDHPKGRHYVIDDKSSYPSATNVLHDIAEHNGELEWLEAWKERLGKKAEEISRRATIRGNAMHDYAETYLKGKDVIGRDSEALELFRVIKPTLDTANVVHALETPVWSHILKVAGTVDCVAEFEYVPTVGDFKNSRIEKTREQIAGYIRQVTTYQMCIDEMTGIKYEFGLIIMGTLNEGRGKPFLQTFEIFFGDYRETVIEEFAEYHDRQGTKFDKEKALERFV